MRVEMLGLLRNTRIRTKLLALVLVPLLGLGYLALARTLDRNAEVSSASELEGVVRVGVAIGNVLHETQKERGMSSGFLTLRGQKFAGQLDEQRVKLDKALGALRGVADAQGSSLNETVRTRLAEALASLEQLPQIRTRVKA